MSLFIHKRAAVIHYMVEINKEVHTIPILRIPNPVDKRIWEEECR